MENEKEVEQEVVELTAEMLDMIAGGSVGQYFY